MAARRKILFVDDEPNVLEGLRRNFRDLRHEWALAFAKSGAEALNILSRVSFDAVVSDIRMPGMDGVQLLSTVKEKYPHIVRIVLSELTDKELALKSIRPAHQFLSKPYNSDKLKDLLARACSLRDRLTDEKLMRLVSELGTLPSMPSLYVALVEEIESEDASISKVGEIISSDVGMTAKILQLVNSAIFGVRQRITSPAQAVSLLGLETIQGLVLSMQVFSKLDTTELSRFSLNSLWEHSMATGAFAREIARAEKADKTLMGDAFMAGMLHDLGKLILVCHIPDAYIEVLKLVEGGRTALYDGELQVFGTTHAEVGAYLMELWGLPEAIVEATALHHMPRDCTHREKSPLLFTHVANVLENEGDEETLQGLDNEYFDSFGLAGRLPVWKEKCMALVEKAETAGA